jgi:hypothetical protein
MKPTQNLWPYAIILTFVLFISGTVSLVVMACSQKADLVSPNYYEEELKFQGQLDRLKRAQQLPGSASVAYDDAQRRITIALPHQGIGHEITGNVQLYRPSEAGLDRHLELRLDEQGNQFVDARSLAPGLWKVRVAWTVDKQDYLVDEKVVVSPATEPKK